MIGEAHAVIIDRSFTQERLPRAGVATATARELVTMPPMRLLQVTGTLDPAYGGPCVVVNQLTRSLTDLGHSVDVVTLDPPSAPWLTDMPGPPRAFGPALGKYGYSRHLRRWLEQHAPDYDAVTVHGIWQYQSQAVRAACRRAGVPYFLFVHGALDPWFRERYPGKHAKKALYWRLFEHRTLRNARAVLYTCEEERRLARTSFTPYQAREAIVGLGIEEPPGDPALQREAFLSAQPRPSRQAHPALPRQAASEEGVRSADRGILTRVPSRRELAPSRGGT